MGQCVSSKHSKNKFQSYDKQPPGTEELRNANLSKFLFNVTLANVKLKKCEYSKVSLKFFIPQVLDYNFQQKSVSGTKEIKWKDQNKTKFQMNQLELRQNFLCIQVYNEMRKLSGSIRINLYIITTGPYHQDFLIEFKNHTSGRLSFDFKISQIIDIQIDSENAQIDLTKKLPGEKFSFSIKPIMEQTQNQLNISVPSYTVMEVLDDTQESEQKQRSPSPPKFLELKRSSSVKIKEPLHKIKTGRNLTWNKSKSLQLPSVNLKILSSDLHHSYFQMIIWKINDQNRQSDEQEEKLQYHAECFISFHKLMSHDPTVFIQNGKKIEERNISVQEKLWMHGRQCGSAKFNFIIRNEIYMKQMPVCVRTQRGIQKLSPIFHSSQVTQSSTQKEIQKLMKINQEISSKMIEAEKFISESSNYREARKLQIQIEQSLMDMKEILQKSAKNSSRIYEYSSPQQLLIAQESFLQIGSQIKEYLENEDHIINEICWLILIALLKRGQFTLAYIGFQQSERKAIELGKINKFLERKMCVAQKYQQFMYKILNLAINSLNTQGMECEKQFAEISCAYAYFRITEFRNEVLNSITRQNDPQITEWRGIQFMLEQDQDFTLLREDMNVLSLLFDWQHCFHKYLPPKSSIKDILKGQKSNAWKTRFAKRSIAFFQFIKRWVEYIESIIPSGKGIQWKYCPGYNRILKAFLIELKTREIKQYPDALKQAALKLLVNQKILSPFVTILFNKANLYDTQTVAQVLQFVSQMFSCLENQNKKIPAIFNFSTFLKGIKLIFQSQASYSISAALILFYNHFKLFPIQFQRNISMFLLSKVFFKLFLHWEENVRNIFYHLLIYRILHEYDILRSDENQLKEQRVLKKQYNFQIRNRYQKLMNILKNADLKRVQEEKKNLKINYQKTLHLRMKKKFQKKRKKPSLKQSRLQKFEQNELNELQKSSIIQSQTRQNSQNKFSLEQLAKAPRIQKAMSGKFDSQLVKVVCENYKTFKTEKLAQNHRKSVSFHFPNQVKDMTQIDDNSKVNKRRIQNFILESYPNLKFFSKQQFDIKELKPQQIHYLKTGLKQFNEILECYANSIANNKFSMPLIKMQLSMIDKRELRPDKIEDW